MSSERKSSSALPASCSSGLAIMVAGTIGLVVGWMHRNPALLSASAVLVFGPAIVFLLLRSVSNQLSVARFAPESVVEGDNVEVTFELQNDSRMSLFFPVIGETLVFEAERHARILFAGRMLPGERLQRSTIARCLSPRGVYPAARSVLQVQDPFGWFSLRRAFDFPQSLTVFPRLHKLELTDIHGRQLDQMCGLHSHPAPGWSDEFLKVREYRPGDSQRRIHWGLTARLGEPVLREFTRLSGGDLYIILDLHRDSVVGRGRNTSLEHAVRIAASLAAHTLEAGQRVHLLAGGNREFHVPAGNGHTQLRRILHTLVHIAPSAQEPILPQLLTNASAELGDGATIVTTISEPLFGNSELEGCFRAWRTQGHHVIPVLFFRSEFPHHGTATGTGSADTKLTDWRQRLHGLGLEPFEVPCGTDFDSENIKNKSLCEAPL